MINWHDASKEKPPSTKEVILLLDTGEQHAGFWLKDANKHERNINKWRVFMGSHMYDEDKVLGWRTLDE